LLPEEIKRYAPEIAAPPVVIEPIDVTVETFWPGTFTRSGTTTNLSAPISIASDQLFGAIILPNIRIVLLGTVNTRMHTINLTAYTATPDLQNTHNVTFAVAGLKRDGDKLTFSGQDPPTNMSFSFTIDQAHLPSFRKFAQAQEFSGSYFGQAEAGRSQVEWEGLNMTAHETGLIHGTTREQLTDVKVYGTADPFFLVTRKGSEGRVGMLMGTATFEGDSIVMEGAWKPPGSDSVGVFSLFRMAS
jgi:hypothetical protein